MVIFQTVPSLSNPIVLTVTITEYVVFIILTWLNILLFRRYRQRKSEIALLLFKTFFWFSIAPLIQPLDILFFDYLTIDTLGYIMSPGYCAAMITGGIGNYFLVHFISTTFFKKETKYPKVIGWIGILVTLIFTINKILDLEEIAFIFQVVHILICFIIYFQLVFLSLKTARRIQEKDLKMGFIFIAFCGIFLSLMYIFIVMESLIYNTYSYLSMVGWILSALACFCAYAGFALPSWLRRILK